MKTFQQKLEIVEKVIRKALPRTKKLSKGCKILFNLNDFHTDVVGEIIGIDDINVAIVITEDLAQRRVSLKNFDKEKIIGHDILLNDVLEWFQKFNKNNDVSFDLYGRFRIYNGNQYSQSTWNLSKPYPKDQSEEFIDFLYDLIKK